jgi:hypothetical protein
MFRLSIVAGVTVAAIALLVADRGLSQGEKKEPAAKVKGQLPTYWKQLGLSEAQKQQVYTTRASYAGKVEALAEQIRKLKAHERSCHNLRIPGPAVA